jgi:hypothetical protein
MIMLLSRIAQAITQHGWLQVGLPAVLRIPLVLVVDLLYDGGSMYDVLLILAASIVLPLYHWLLLHGHC